jgi:hypothetical protein
MTPNGLPGNANRQPGPIALGILKDIGWNLNPALESHSLKENYDVAVFPNPTSNVLYLSSPATKALCSISDCTGRVVTRETYDVPCSINVWELKPGYYFLSLETAHVAYRTAFVKQ